jgi:hypothetical protein
MAFEFEKDAKRRDNFITQARTLCQFRIEDLSLSSAVHDSRWQQEAKKRIKKSQLLIVLLGQDTHSAPGVKDELSLAGEVGCPVVQLMPQHKNYGQVGSKISTCEFKWVRINEMLRDPKGFVTKSR